ncbi:hypothetical protein CHUAL_008048 [Chamberlinius hualienensis]
MIMGGPRRMQVQYVNKNLSDMKNMKLIDVAHSSGFLHGYWKIDCQDDNSLNSCWKAIASEFYTSQANYLYVACNHRATGGGYIHIATEDFTQVDLAFELIERVRSLAIRHRYVVFQTFYYVPAFYAYVGINEMKNVTGLNVDNYIYSYSINNAACNYALEIEQWLVRYTLCKSCCRMF